MTISVILVTYNGANFITEQLISILNQSYNISEIIIIDDCSTDDTLHIIHNILILTTVKSKILKNSKNIGTRKNFEIGINYASGDLVLFSDQDDIWDQNKCLEIKNHFECRSDISAVFTDGYLLVDNKIISRSLWDSIYFSGNIKSSVTKFNLFEFLILRENVATGATMAFKKKDLKSAIPFICHNEIWHDYWLALFFASQNKLDFLNKKLITYRVHQNQQVGLFKKNFESAIQLRNSSWFCDFDLNNRIELLNFYKYLLISTSEFYKKTCCINISLSARLLIANKKIHDRLIYVKYQPNSRFIKLLKMIKHYFFQDYSLKISLFDIYKHAVLNWQPVQF